MNRRSNSFFKCSPVLALRIVLVIILSVSVSLSYAQIKPRIIITADPELDDANSLIRFLLYSTDFRVEGLIYASSQFHWTGDGKGTKLAVPGREYTKFGLNLCPCESYRWAKDERFIDDIVENYEKVYSNLKVHHSDYPTPLELKSKIRKGNIEFDGDFSKDSPGSDLIKSLMLDDYKDPLYITAWGGQSTIARALKSIEDQYKNKKEWNGIRNKILSKVVLLPSGDQDNTYEKYIKIHWPEIDYRQMGRGPNYSYGIQMRASPENIIYTTASWMSEEPLRMVTGFLGQLEQNYSDVLDAKGKKYIHFAADGAKRMRQIILDSTHLAHRWRKA
ncbi:nucleoside hydrolase-like domain-containing protein [Daejeonella sp.]|uniref:DUF1593 domain-containing protein n=1 Tax=Daejeonella sp. TaxID=2805397 RepID=UPI003982FC60